MVDGGVTVSQFLVTPFMVFGVAESAFCVLAIGTATLRDSGVFQAAARHARCRRGRCWPAAVAAAAVMALASAAVLVAVGVVGFGVQIVWAKVPAAVVTLRRRASSAAPPWGWPSSRWPAGCWPRRR